MQKLKSVPVELAANQRVPQALRAPSCFDSKESSVWMTAWSVFLQGTNPKIQPQLSLITRPIKTNLTKFSEAVAFRELPTPIEPSPFPMTWFKWNYI